MVFPVIMHVRESWTVKKAECQRINHFELWCWKRLFRVPWTGRRSNQPVLQEINPEYSMHQKDWCWSWSSNTLGPLREEPNHWKRPWCWERLKAGEKGMTEDEMVGWHHQLLEFSQTHVPQVGDAIQPSHPLSSPSLLPSIPLSIRVFSNESVLRIRWPKYWSVSFNISPSKEYSGLISSKLLLLSHFSRVRLCATP